MPALTVKTEGKKLASEPITPIPLLLPFEKVKGSNAKMLHSSFMFGGKVLKAKEKDSKSNGFISLKNVIVAGSPQKHRAGKAFKKSFKKKLKIGPAEPLVFGRTNRQKGKTAIITEADKKEIVKKPQPKQKMKCLCHSETPVELMEALNSKKEPEGGVFSVLQQFIATWQGNETKVCVLCQIYF